MKNVVFDIGNVVVRWSPQDIIRSTFGADSDSDALLQAIFRHDLWIALNMGEISERDAKLAYQQALSIDAEKADDLFFHVKDSQVLIEGTVDLIQRLSDAGYCIYALTDNVHEIVAHLKERYDFWEHFLGVVVSAEINMMKPHAEIFHYLLNEHALNASETVFIDDHPPNVAGASAVGITGIQFENPARCEQDLRQLGLVF